MSKARRAFHTTFWARERAQGAADNMPAVPPAQAIHQIYLLAARLCIVARDLETHQPNQRTADSLETIRALRLQVKQIAAAVDVADISIKQAEAERQAGNDEEPEPEPEPAYKHRANESMNARPFQDKLSSSARAKLNELRIGGTQCEQF
jgi:hypothetical protein